MEKKKPLGKSIKWSDADLDLLSVVTPADIEASKALVESASPTLAAIINAEPVDAENKPLQ